MDATAGATGGVAAPGANASTTCTANNEQTAPPTAIPYAVGTQVKRLRAKTLYFGDCSCWCPAKIIDYNATTYRYTIQYEEGENEDLEHNDINTEPFPREPRYPCGMKLEENVCLVSEIVARCLYIPSDNDHSQIAPEDPTWFYRVKDTENEARVHDLHEPMINIILGRMQQRRYEEEPSQLREYFDKHQISHDDIAKSIHVLQVVAQLAATKSSSSESSSSNNGTEKSKKRNRQQNNNSDSNSNDADVAVLENENNSNTDSALSEVLDLLDNCNRNFRGQPAGLNGWSLLSSSNYINPYPNYSTLL